MWRWLALLILLLAPSACAHPWPRTMVSPVVDQYGWKPVRAPIAGHSIRGFQQEV